MMNFIIRRAQMSDLAEVAELFDFYRQSAGQPANLSMAKVFIGVRLKQNDSVIFVAEALIDGTHHLLGFLQLIPSFSAIAARPIWLLNDPFVRLEWHGEGIEAALLQHAQEFGRESGVKRLVLETAQANTEARQRYEQSGFTQVSGVVQYHYDI